MLRIGGLAILIAVVLPALLGYAASFSISPVVSQEFHVAVEDVETEQIGGPAPLARSVMSTEGEKASAPEGIAVETPPEPIVIDPVPVYLGQTCLAFTPAGATWREFVLDASGGLVDGDYLLDSLLALSLSNVSGTAFDWAATFTVEAVMVQTRSGSGNLYAYDPAALAGAGLASPNPDITTVSFCVDTPAPDDGGEADGDPAGDGDGIPPEPEIDAPDKAPEPFDANPAPFFSLDPGGQ